MSFLLLSFFGFDDSLMLILGCFDIELFDFCCFDLIWLCVFVVVFVVCWCVCLFYVVLLFALVALVVL